MLQKFFDFLLGLESVSLRDWAKLRLGFAVDWPGPVIFLACVALLVIGYWSYRKQSASPAKRRAMGVVRGVMLALVFLLLCRPQLVLDFDEKTPSVVAVWIDNSLSATIEDPYRDLAMKTLVQQVSTEAKLPWESTRPSRYHLAADSLSRAKWLRTIAEHQTIMFFTGSNGVDRPVGTVEALHEGQDIAEKSREIDQIAAQLKKAKLDDFGDSTDVPTVVQDICNYVTKNGRRLSAIVMLTDGQSNQGSRLDLAALAAAQAKVKLFALPLGQAESPLNLKLGNVQAPKNTFVHDPVAVTVKLEWTGLDRPGTVKVSLWRQQPAGAEEKLTEQDVPVAKGDGKKDVELIFKPNKKTSAEKSETFNLIAKVEPGTPLGGEELTLSDNVGKVTMQVHEAEMNVLYVEGYPRWEYRYLKNEFIREKTVNVSALLLSADENFAQEGDPRKLDKDGREIFPGPITRFPETAAELALYDVILIGDVEPTFFTPTQMNLIIEHVRKDGAGLAWIAGPAYNPDSYRGTPLEVLLPVIADDPLRPTLPRADNTGFNPVLTAEGKASNLFRFYDTPEKNIEQMSKLPELYYFKPVIGCKPTTEVLAVHPTRSQGGQPAPLIVTGHFGKGRILYSAICDTWRWRRYTGEPLFQSYWLQMARLLYRDRAMGQENRRIEMLAETSTVEVGKQATITLEIKDPTLTSQIAASQIPVKLISTKDGRPLDTMTLTRSALPERYEGKVTLRETGEVTAQVDTAAAGGGLPVPVLPVTLNVTPPGREFERITTDLESLTTLATRTTGAVLPLPQADDLSKRIPDRSLPVLTQRSEELWVKPIALAMVLLLLTIEWLIRKSAGLI